VNVLAWLRNLFAGCAVGPNPTGALSLLPSSSVLTSAIVPKSLPLRTSGSARKPSDGNRIATLPLIALAEVGKKETKGNNLGAEVRKYQSATTLPPGAWPYCAAFCCWVLDQWLDDPENRKWLALKKSSPQAWRPKTALAYGFLKWAKARPATVQILPDTAEPEPGMFVIYDFSHIGIVKRNIDATFFEAVEGNTNSAGSRDGDGVYVKRRRRSLARAFLRVRPSVAS
jgi:hypothetical protein